MMTALRITVPVLLALWTTTAGAQSFPERAVRFIIPFPPGAGPDVIARTLAPVLGERWRQQLVVDNRPGGGGNIATELAARSAPDGYTVLLASNHVTINPSLYRKIPYDPLRDFVPLTLAAITPNILVVHPSVPVRSVKEFIAFTRTRPGQLNFSSGGNGSVGHLAGEMFKAAAGVDLVHVPYKGPVAAITALLSGEASAGFLLTAAALPQIKAGKLRGLAVTGKARSPAAPELPTVAEAGLPGYEIVAWQGLFAPAGTPSAIASRIRADVVSALETPEVKKALLTQGIETVGSASDEFAAYLRRDLAKWSAVVKQANVRID